MDVGDFLFRCSALKPVLTGEKDADFADQTNLSWCISHLSDILEDYRKRALKSNQVKAIGICLPEGTTNAELLLIVLDELQTHNKSAKLANVITSSCQFGGRVSDWFSKLLRKVSANYALYTYKLTKTERR
jgi:hypothetical protein